MNWSYASLVRMGLFQLTYLLFSFPAVLWRHIKAFFYEICSMRP